MRTSSSPPGGAKRASGFAGCCGASSSEEKARGSLRQALHQLRELFESIGFAGLIVGRDDISLRAPLFSVDVWAIEESAAETGDVHPLLLDRKRLPETLLCGLEELDPSFRLWLLVQRQALHERLARRLERALDAAGREPSTQVDLATALLNLDPTHEGACRILMEDHAAHGDTAGALRVYKALWDLLEDEYDSEPSDQTKDLVVRIKTGEFKGRAPAESAESVSPEPPLGPSAPLSKALSSGNVLPSEPAVPAHNLLIVSEFDSRGVGERPGSAHGLARRGLGPCGADLPVDHRRGAAFRPGLYRARPPQELGAPGPSRPRSQRGGAAAGARAEQGRRRGRPLRRPRAPLLRLVLGARAPVRPGRAELRPRPRAQRERPLDAHLERLGTAYCGKHREALELADQALRIDPNPSRAHWGYQAQTRFLCEDYTGSVTAAARALNVLPFLSAWHAAALGHLGYREDARDKARSFVEASRANWHGRTPPTEEAIASWLLRAFPIRDPADLERLREGLRLAGLPAPAEPAGRAADASAPGGSGGPAVSRRR